jgi:hypothetical protein
MIGVKRSAVIGWEITITLKCRLGLIQKLELSSQSQAPHVTLTIESQNFSIPR